MTIRVYIPHHTTTWHEFSGKDVYYKIQDGRLIIFKDGLTAAIFNEWIAVTFR